MLRFPSALSCSVICLLLLSIVDSIHPQEAKSAEDPPTQETKRLAGARAVQERDWENQYRYARELASDGYLTKARQVLQNLLIVEPDHKRNLDALLLLAEIAQQADLPDEAVRVYTEAYRRFHKKEKAVRGYVTAAQILARLGEKEKSRTMLAEILRSWPGSEAGNVAQTELDSMRLLDSRQNNEAMDQAEDMEKTKSTVDSDNATTENKEDNPLDRMGEGIEEL